uniref:S-crystallin 4 n=1 Tax=Enteroctopus dofleini TaxID=267067 RepID=SCRY4_ENTDO|nr:RecName: Full=S-crystallin 4; AltName: Full=OL4 [Enteroctopus dofleini]AAA29389.1 S4-crystallin [Enteroctopus dofleini]
MPSYTLHYFNHRGRAEICRMLFAAAGVQYNDRRIESSEWGSMRSKMPCSMMPMLELDNKIQIPQSMAMARYLAREFGFHGKNNMDMARVDYISDSFYDILDDYMRMYHDKDGRMMFSRSKDMNSSSEKRMRYQETCRRIFPYLEKTLEMRNGGNQFFMGDQITMADMMCFCALENPLMEDQNILRSYPKLQALRNRVINHPKMSAYLQKRSRTEF